MRIGDLLEWLAGAGFTGAAYDRGGVFWALVVVGVCLLYLAQCYGAAPCPRPHGPRFLKRFRRKASE